MTLRVAQIGIAARNSQNASVLYFSGTLGLRVHGAAAFVNKLNFQDSKDYGRGGFQAFAASPKSGVYRRLGRKFSGQRRPPGAPS